MPSRLLATIDELERAISRDPGRRGLIAGNSADHTLCGTPWEAGQLAAAAQELAQAARRVGIVTGFYIPSAEPPAAETDGPPGAVLLASALLHAQIDTILITDNLCASALRAAMQAAEISSTRLLVLDKLDRVSAQAILDCPPTDSDSDGPLSHLVAIERPGPSHHPDSIRSQVDTAAAADADQVLHEFHDTTETGQWDQCHNMRGVNIESWTAPLHLLFEAAAAASPRRPTIGIGDGGNEIGMGRILWRTLYQKLGLERAHIPCRIATDWNLVAGTSNWGAQALSAAVALLGGHTDWFDDWNVTRQAELLDYLCQHGPAVDGVTGRQQPTVDGLPVLTYMQPWERIRELVQGG